ncbi:hypothetical protein [Methylobacterium marchantiae]|uniref:Uncharacterized protein n=1 Tax=Methylobacterium marchantiae TaxID=600331 RepID=A0ABW3X3J2_9HYPH
MRIRVTPLIVGLASIIVTVGSSGVAEAFCLRQVANRSRLILVVSQAGGVAITVQPGTSRKILLDGPAPVKVSGYCGNDQRSDMMLKRPIIQRSFAVTALQDRCYYKIGNDFFERELGPSFFPREGTEPFALNAPRQGDLALGPTGAACPFVR